MLQLIYMSTARLSSSDATVAALCEQAARNNGRDEITGVLMAHAGTFLQVLEGPREAVEDTFLRIMVDERHHSVLLLNRKLTTRCEFGDWAMATSRSGDERRQVIQDVRSRMVGAADHVRRRFDERFGVDAGTVEDRRRSSDG